MQHGKAGAGPKPTSSKSLSYDPDPERHPKATAFTRGRVNYSQAYSTVTSGCCICGYLSRFLCRGVSDGLGVLKWENLKRSSG